MAVSVNQLSFASGEVSRSIWGRTDLGKYATGLKVCQNFIVRAHGGVENRAGTHFIAETKYHDKKCRLIPFEFSATQTYILEFGHLYIRFYTQSGQIVDDQGKPVEIESPYMEEELPLLKYVQSADLLTLCHPSHHPKNLGRYSHTDWRLTDFINKNGPFNETNIDESIAVSVSAQTGEVTIKAAKDLFQSVHVGVDFYIEEVNSPVTKWSANSELTYKANIDGTKIRSNGKTYIAAGNPWRDSFLATGATAPNHEEGREWDGPGRWDNGAEKYYGVCWQFLHCGFGVVKITEIIDTKTAKGTVLSIIPEGCIGTGSSYKWAFPAWSEEAGFPKTAMYHQQRLIFASTRKQPQTIWMSKTGQYNHFGHSFPGKDDDAITLTISSRQINEIRYLVPLNNLVALTSAGEWVIGDPDQPLTPSTVRANIQGYRGCSNNIPLIIGSTALFIQEKGSFVRDLNYRFDENSYSGEDLSVMANHLFEGYQISDWTYAQIPYSICWAVRNDGVMLGLTYMREQQVWGWHRHTTDGAFENVCAISEHEQDKVYLCVRREINGEIRRYIEVMQNRQKEPIEEALYLDCGLSYHGEAKQHFVGLDHLEGKQVSILADGNVHPKRWVKNGQVTLDFAASVVHMGLPYLSEIETLDINIPTQETLRDKQKIINEVYLYLETTRGGWVGERRDRMYEFKPRSVSDNYDPIQTITGLFGCHITSSWNKAGTFIVQQRDPLPMSILNAIPSVTAGGV